MCGGSIRRVGSKNVLRNGVGYAASVDSQTVFRSTVTPTHSTHLPDLYQTVAMFFFKRLSKVYHSDHPDYTSEEEAVDRAMLRMCEQASRIGQGTVEQSTFASPGEMDLGVNPPEAV
jgi:hypothetical protein